MNIPNNMIAKLDEKFTDESGQKFRDNNTDSGQFDIDLQQLKSLLINLIISDLQTIIRKHKLDDCAQYPLWIIKRWDIMKNNVEGTFEWLVDVDCGSHDDEILAFLEDIKKVLNKY